MREEMLKRFFQGRASATELAKDVAGSKKQVSNIVSNIHIEDIEEEFNVTRPMLVALCDAVLSGSLPAESLATIGFALESSDNFVWDGDEDELVAEVIADWACPEVNYPLTHQNVQKSRSWLTSEQPYPTRPSTPMAHDGKIISVVQKKSIERHRRRPSKRLKSETQHGNPRT